MNKFNSQLNYFVTFMLCIATSLLGQINDSTISESDSLGIDSTKNEAKQIIYKIGDLADGNKSVPVHLIKLFDENGYSIHKGDQYTVPFSTKNTCGDCHTYELIKQGTHFAFDTSDTTKHKGEPFIYSNHKSLTVLPLSYGNFQGTINPDSIGISPFQFTKMFGSHITGGNLTENEELQKINNYLRWQVSGKLEINCLVCHDSDPEYDQAEFAKQIKNENFRWAGSAASSIANVKGFASKMPDNFDPYNTNTFVDVDLRTTPAPSVTYTTEKFNEDNKVFFDIDKNIKNERCLFCHTTTLNSDDKKFITEQQDVHITSGMKCVACHKNDIGHNITAGYEDEHLVKNDKNLFSFTCEGCHISTEENKFSGRFGAPMPYHEGIPSIHFEKLSCTVCHSSYYPEEKTQIVKTSRAHKLGVPGPNKMPSTYPLIQSPVFVRAANGKLEPHNLIWPSYWARKKDNNIIPLDISFVEDNIQPLLGLDSLYNFGEWPQVEDSTLISVLDSINIIFGEDSKIVFISNGKAFEKNGNSLIRVDFDEAKPYTWSIAHNVRPAQQSLGINGCYDCHSIDSDFYFGNVSIISSVKSEGKGNISMSKFEDLNSLYHRIFSFSFYFRPALKIILLISTIAIILIVFSYILSGIKSGAEYFSSDLNSNQENNI